MNTKIKALAWEELRVAGAISAWCVLLSALYIALCRVQLGPRAWAMQDSFLVPIVYSIPVLIALLLVLNPNQSGHLIGGFARRVLWLPVPTSIAVAVTLGARTLFVFTSSLLLLAIPHAIFGSGPSLLHAFLFAGLYLIAQLIDWMREPISGLTSALIVIAIVSIPLLLLRLGGDWKIGDPRLPDSMTGLLFGAAAVMAIIYALSTAAVHAARVGLRVGVPEIWELPRRFDLGSTKERGAFSSPMAAQIWYAFRQSKLILPAGTVLLSLLLFGTALLILSYGERIPPALAPIIFVPLLLAAAAHGIHTRVVGFRSVRGKAGYSFRQPLTSAQYAWAQIVVNAVTLVPMVIAVVALHFVLGGGKFLSEVVPFAFTSGAANLRELTWIFISRGILLVLLAWPLMAIGTRTISLLIPLLFTTAILITIAIHAMFPVRSGEAVVSILFWAIASLGIFVCAGCLAQAWRKHIIASRDVSVWIAVWALAAWLLHGVFPAQPKDAAIPALNLPLEVVSCVAYASLLPLPFAALALDVARRRHGVAGTQDPTQHQRTRVAVRRSGKARFIRASTAVTALLALWLGWRGSPGYVEYLRGIGWPASIEVLETISSVPPGRANVATRYLAIGDEVVTRGQKFFAENGISQSSRRTDEFGAPIWPLDLIIGEIKGMAPSAALIDPTVRDMAERYWEAVVQPVAPTLKDIAAADAQASSYPIDLTHGYTADLSHLNKLLTLGRALYVDTVHWSLLGDSRSAHDATLAILPLQQSLANEPFIISQLRRIALLSMSVDSLEFLLNHTTPTDEELVRLQERFAHALPPVSETRIMDTAIRGECIMGLTAVNEISMVDGQRQQVESSDLLERLLFPVAAEQVTLLHNYKHAIDHANWPWTTTPINFGDTDAFAPISSMLMGSIYRSYEAEWRIRMNLDIAQAAIAVERFRRAEGRLPDRLSELVPKYLAATPTDYYSSALVRSVRRDDGSFMIYSIGRNQVDEHGLDSKHGRADDFAFNVSVARQ
ncbi:MAG: hypothetical protein IT366_06650 [Candidatus Hydrogenedentes bacterium]|nr:hypothetical protein [Candidatus Hydrogenedentota bacterium]